jgi:hypothetical protein
MLFRMSSRVPPSNARLYLSSYTVFVLIDTPIRNSVSLGAYDNIDPFQHSAPGFAGFHKTEFHASGNGKLILAAFWNGRQGF